MKNFITPSSRRAKSAKSLIGSLVAGASLAALFVAGSPVAEVSARPAGKITICHRTHSVTNPYRRITVSLNSITRNSGHSNVSHNQVSTDTFASSAYHNPTGSPAINVFDPGHTYTANQKKWGDIIPGNDTEGTALGGTSSIAQNYTGNGREIILGIGSHAGLCKAVSTSDFIAGEVAAGKNETEVRDDLKDQEATEDAALRDACGATLTGCATIEALSTAVSVATNDPTGVTTSTGTLNGAVKCGTAANTKWYFEYGTSATLATSTQFPATAGTVTTSPQTEAQTLTGLADGTYYYRIVCVTGAGTDEEGIISGAIKSFSISSSNPAPTTVAPATTAAATATAAPATTVAAKATAKAKAKTAVATAETLPATGNSSNNLMPIALMTLIFGAGLAAAARRRRITE